MTVWIKRVVWLLVIYGVLYVLIAPLPGVGAAFSGKSALDSFALVTYALLELFFLALAVLLGPSGNGFSSAADVLDRTCVRLC